MRNKLLSSVAMISLLAGQASAGGLAEPVMEPSVIVEDTASSAGGIVVPLLFLLLVAAMAANSGGGGGAVPTTPIESDARLKTDIEWMGVGPHGHSVYRYRYKGTKQQFEGVMAQEVALRRPDAVIRRPNGLLAVDYARLGIEMRLVA